MKTKKLIFLGVCLFSGLMLGEVSYATSFNSDDIGQSNFNQSVITSQESSLPKELSKPINSSESEEKVIEFKDAHLEDAIKTELGIPHDQQVTTSSILNLRKIQPSVSGISDLTGLEYAKNLQLVTFNNNELKSLKQLENLTNLTSIGLVNSPYLSIDDIRDSLSNLEILQLDLSNNAHMGDFSKLSGFTNLRDLWLNNCNLNNVDFLENMTFLTSLFLNNNNLSTVNQLSSSFLYTLELNQNQIESLDDLAISTVAYLQINNNKLMSLNHTNLPRLASIQANSNNITSVEDFNAPILSALSLDNNQISSIKNIYAPQLTELIIRFSQLEKLDGLENFPMLMTLNIASNKVKDLSPIKDLTRLTTLTVQNNLEIDDFSPISFATNLKQLYAIDTNMNNDKIKQLGELQNLEILGVSNLNTNSTNEKLTNLDFLPQFPALTGIAFDGHSVSDISKIGDLGIPIYSALNQKVTLPSGTLGQKTIINLADKYRLFPASVNFVTSGELVNDPSQTIQSVVWNQTGENSFTFSSSDKLFSGSVNQYISTN